MARVVRLFIRRCLALGPRSGPVFFRESVRRLLGIPDHGLGRPLAGCASVVFACHGNILRSPAAAALFVRALDEAGIRGIAVRSAGLRARAGRAADPRGLAAGARLGIDLSAHEAARLSPAMVRAADAVVVFDFSNQADFLARFPRERAKLRLLGAFDPAARASLEIADPFLLDQAAVARCYEEVGRCVRGLVASLHPPAITTRERTARAPG